MLTKKKILQTIKDLPDQFSIEDLFERIIVIQKIEEGLEQSQKGQTVQLKRRGKG